MSTNTQVIDRSLRVSGSTTCSDVYGGSDANVDLNVRSTSHATKGKVRIWDVMWTDAAVVVNRQFDSAYTFSVQSPDSSVWFEMLGGTNAAQGRGVFWGIEGDNFELWSYQAGSIDFFTSTSYSDGTKRVSIMPNGDFQVHNCTVGVLKSSASGVVSSEAEQAAFNCAFGTSAGTVAEGDHTHVANDITDFDAAADARADARIALQRGAISGLAELDVNGRVPVSQMAVSAFVNRGNWNASTNTPTLSDGSGENGDTYYVSVAGSTALDGISEWAVGDRVVSSDTAWLKQDNTDAVQSVAGMTGAVTLVMSNITDAGDAATRNTGQSSGSVAKVGTGGLANTEIVVTNGAGNLETVAKATAFNKALGTSAGTVAEGNHTHDASAISAGTLPNARIQVTGVTQHVAAIDHDSLLNYDIAKHRVIDDAAVSTTKLWSSSHIDSQISGIASSKFFNAYDATGGQTFDTGTITLNLDTTRSNSGDFTLANDEVTITTSDTYEIIFRVSTDVSSGTWRSISKCWLERDQGGGFVVEPGTDGFMYNRMSPEGNGSSTVPLTLTCSAGDKLRIQVSSVSGTDILTTTINASSLSISTPGGGMGPAGPAVDIGAASALSTVDGAADYMLVRDATDGVQRKLLLNDIPSAKTIRTPHGFAISGEIKVPVGNANVIGSLFVSLAAGQSATAVSATHMIQSGTSVTLSVFREGTAIANEFTDIAVSTTKTTTTLTTPEALTEGDQLTIVVSAVSGDAPTLLNFTLFLEHTVQ